LGSTAPQHPPHRNDRESGTLVTTPPAKTTATGRSSALPRTRTTEGSGETRRTWESGGPERPRWGARAGAGGGGEGDVEGDEGGAHEGVERTTDRGAGEDGAQCADHVGDDDEPEDRPAQGDQ